uniref:Uncharacterized protein n=1 Tax=Candidatus Kentrum sp. LPFa TaxID=2126335 RepID=A0A450W787_9GAMM|nr:MAG: hypothetical protein BECKLPF1236A_GA0070988_100797 [Candidatus Kentron sp. LPFa]VFK29161.1 MAG: hypothetical protein BECKLPF1236C_GA0070990_100816 [Candidatus Kentron sp. LPFa]
MTTMMREPECVLLKRRGAEHVEKLIAGMSLQEQEEENPPETFGQRFFGSGDGFGNSRFGGAT